MKLVLICILLLTTNILFAQSYLVISSANFRNKPGLHTVVKNVIHYKDTLIEIKQQDNWSNVIWNGDSGWVWTDFITDEIGITEYFEVDVKIGAVCKDGTIQRKISTNNVCKYNDGIDHWLFATYVFRNGRKQFLINN